MTSKYEFIAIHSLFSSNIMFRSQLKNYYLEPLLLFIELQEIKKLNHVEFPLLRNKLRWK